MIVKPGADKSMYTKEQLTEYAYFEETLGRRDVSFVLDPLTGLVSRQYILGFARALIGAGTPFTFGMLDLDNFKFINDAYGHHAGDQVLISVAESLSSFLSGRGVAGRFGGDELMWINLRDREYADKKAFLADMYESRRILRRKVALEDCAPFITGTVGCATFPDDARDFDSLFEMIDKTLYRGKSKGRNCYIIYVKEKHADIEIPRIARKGVCSTMCNIARTFERAPGLMDKLRAVAPLLIDELKLTDLYYVGQDRVLRAVGAEEVRERVDDIDGLTRDELFTTNELERVRDRCPMFHGALIRREVETLMVVRIGMDSARTDGYLICAEPHNRRIWQEDECAVVYFLAKLIAARIRIDGEAL